MLIFYTNKPCRLLYIFATKLILTDAGNNSSTDLSSYLLRETVDFLLWNVQSWKEMLKKCDTFLETPLKYLIESMPGMLMRSLCYNNTSCYLLNSSVEFQRVLHTPKHSVLSLDDCYITCSTKPLIYQKTTQANTSD